MKSASKPNSCTQTQLFQYWRMSRAPDASRRVEIFEGGGEGKGMVIKTDEDGGKDIWVRRVSCSLSHSSWHIMVSWCQLYIRNWRRYKSSVHRDIGVYSTSLKDYIEVANAYVLWYCGLPCNWPSHSVVWLLQVQLSHYNVFWLTVLFQCPQERGWVAQP